MEVLWDRGESTVAEVVERLRGSSKLAYSSVLTILRILERKQYVKHEKKGRAFVYRAVVARDDARRKALDFVMSRFFDSSPELLVLNVLESEDLTPEDLRRLRKLIEEAE